MLLSQIIVLTFILFIFRIFFWPKSKNWILFILSLIAVYWFQTPSAIRHLSFWLPTILLTISIIGWKIIIPQENVFSRDDYFALILILFFPIVFFLFKQIGVTGIQFISDSPQIIVLLIIPGFIFLYWLISKRFSINKKLTSGFLLIILLVFLIILKNQTLTKYLSSLLRQLSGQSVSLAMYFDVSWVGFSYFAFRLIHVLVDRERLKKMNISLRDFVTYLIFFPAFSAGPIDRIERFHGELNKPEENLLNDDSVEGGMRIFRGLFLKFILADSLALISLNSYSANMVNHGGWLWLSIYAYAFRIFFDFSGYTDIAIGIARIAGIKLPENFKRPYLSKNITLFWNNWHITLTQWFRTYYFNPVTRFFRLNFKNVTPSLLIFFTQISTMVLIGLWHGISWNFVIWGFWNGIGLFIHNRWTEKVKPKLTFLNIKPFSLPYNILSVIFTFNFIALGWVWFALPNINDSITVFAKLF
jgi:D-alanyl-lipoteichoic acid acyltransferase DltB (MBOAT superfamily)